MNRATIPPIPQDALDTLSEESRASVERLATFLAAAKLPDLAAYPRNILAAVLVLLYQEDGELRVLLTTRSKALRTHAGQTALPGGKVDESDKDLVATAFREANEEIQLPLNSPYIHRIGIYEPFLSLHKLVVTPVYALLTQPDVLGELRPSEKEVARIFSHPLKAILDPQLAQHEALVAVGSEDWPYETDYHNTNDLAVPMLGNAAYRMHRFRSVASPIKGLTSDILIITAEAIFGKTTVYERFAPGQLRGFDAILAALSTS